MTFLSDEFKRAKDIGRFNSVPHIKVWFDIDLGWRASCGVVMCYWMENYKTPEEAVSSAVTEAISLHKRGFGS